jgi:2-polyprenyl-3-methyl-5-hydroxy-6-metoxy-1,4-benzoquinol methylase
VATIFIGEDVFQLPVLSPLQSAESVMPINFEQLDHCPVCGHKGFRVEYGNVKDYLCDVEGSFSYVRCDNCQLVFLNPRPTAEDLAKCYVDYHTHQAEPLAKSFLEPWGNPNRWIRGGILAKKYGYTHLAPSAFATYAACLLDILPSIRQRARCGLGSGAASGLPHFTGNGRALDIGTGSGIYAATLKRLGWQISGVDFDAQAAEVAAACHNLTIYKEKLDSIGFTDSHFDFISMFDVIEHLAAPLHDLRECYRIIRPGGRIMIRTPNYDSLTRKKFGMYWRGLEAPRHLCLFNADNLKYVVESVGFRVVKHASSDKGTAFYMNSSQTFQQKATNADTANTTGQVQITLAKLRIQLLAAFGQKTGDVLHLEAIRP